MGRIVLQNQRIPFFLPSYKSHQAHLSVRYQTKQVGTLQQGQQVVHQSRL
jgi:hypothetical protein